MNMARLDTSIWYTLNQQGKIFWFGLLGFNASATYLCIIQSCSQYLNWEEKDDYSDSVNSTIRGIHIWIHNRTRHWFQGGWGERAPPHYPQKGILCPPKRFWLMVGFIKYSPRLPTPSGSAPRYVEQLNIGFNMSGNSIKYMPLKNAHLNCIILCSTLRLYIK